MYFSIVYIVFIITLLKSVFLGSIKTTNEWPKHCRMSLKIKIAIFEVQFKNYFHVHSIVLDYNMAAILTGLKSFRKPIMYLHSGLKKWIELL